MSVGARAALYTAAGSSLATCARHADRAGLRVVTMIDEDRTGVGLGGDRLNALVDRLGDGEFEVIVASTGADRVVTIAAVETEDLQSDDESTANAAADDLVSSTSSAECRCAIYLRSAMVSQWSLPLAVQRAVCEAYATKQGWKTVEVYEDPGVSGIQSFRRGLDRMMVQGRRRAFDVILIEDLDRLGRDSSQIKALFSELGTLAIPVHSVVGGIISPLEAVIRTVVNQSLHRERAERVRRSRRKPGQGSAS